MLFYKMGRPSFLRLPWDKPAVLIVFCLEKPYIQSLPVCIILRGIQHLINSGISREFVLIWKYRFSIKDQAMRRSTVRNIT